MPLPNTWQLDAIGTSWTIATSKPLNEAIQNNVRALIDGFDTMYSRFRPDSLIRTIAKKAGTYTFKDDDFAALYQLYIDLYGITDGAVTPLVGDTLVSAGYDESYALGEFKRGDISPFSSISWDGHQTITLNKPEVLDIGAAGKGLLVDKVVRILREKSVGDFVVDASGDLYHESSSAYEIGFEHPANTSMVIGTVSLHHEAMCASSINRRSWGSGHHVIDGRTGIPTDDIVATWCIANATMQADGIATGLFFEWKKIEARYPDAGLMRMHRDGTVQTNQVMQRRATLFTSSN